MRCPVCEKKSFFPYLEIFDDRYGEPNKYKLVKCKKCNHISTSPRLKEEDLENLYGKYYPRKNLKINEIVSESKKCQGIFSEFKRWFLGTNNQGQYYLKRGQKVLDIGCGSCVSILEAKSYGADVYGLETDTNIKSISEKLNLKINFGTIYTQDLPANFFDVIIMNQVLEHFPDPDLSLKKLEKNLKSNGKMIIVIPNSNSFWKFLTGIKWINWHVPYHLHHFNERNFRIMINKCNFKVTKKKTITPNIWTIMQIKSIFKRPIKGKPNKIWSVKINQNNIRTKKNINIRKTFSNFIKYTSHLILFLINRPIDTLGYGDSLIFFIKKKDR